jgi:RNA polymerase sigma-70 factor, ECF subfamily
MWLFWGKTLIRCLLTNNPMAIDHQSFDKCFRESFEALTRYAYTYVRDVDQSKEIVQNVFVKIWERRDSLSMTANLTVYLYQAVKNHSLNFQRAKRRTTVMSVIPDVPLDENEENNLPSPEVINEQVSNLPTRCRQVFLLKKFHGLSYKEISVRLNISEKSVENQMTIAFKKLRLALGYVTIKNNL